LLLYAAFVHKLPSRGLAGYSPELRGERESPRLFAEGFYRYSVLSSSPDVSNHHLDLLVLLAQRFTLRLRDRLEPFSVLAV
jgi:hypothetical protein